MYAERCGILVNRNIFIKLLLTLIVLSILLPNNTKGKSKEMEVETEKVDKEITTTVSPAVMIGNSHTQSVKEEVKKQFWLSAPLIGVSLLQYSLQVISVTVSYTHLTLPTTWPV